MVASLNKNSTNFRDAHRRTTTRNPDHTDYPYLLRGPAIERRDQVWSTDVTYLPLEGGYMFLTAVIDWHSRFVLAWRTSNTLDGRFCLEALETALEAGRPEIFNTDQGAQFTARPSPGAWSRSAWRSAWTVGDAPWTTCSSTNCKYYRNMGMFT